MYILLIVFLSFIAATKACIQGLFSRKLIKNSTDNIFYNTLIFLSTVIVFVIIFGIQIPSKITLYCGLMYGLLSVVFQISYVSALSTGPVSLTVLLTNFSLAIPILVAAFIYNEIPSTTQLIGVIILLFCFKLVTRKRNDKNISMRWLLLSLTCFFSAGLSFTVQKIHQNTAFKGEYQAFTIFAYLFATVLSFIIYYYRNTKKKRTVPFDYKILLSSLIIGLILGGYNTTVLYLSGTIKSVILIPMLNGLSTIFVTLYGIIVFKDELSKKQIISIVLGVVSIVLISRG